jgi:hypothetical protein
VRLRVRSRERLAGRIRDGAIETEQHSVATFSRIVELGWPVGFAMARLKRAGVPWLKTEQADIGWPVGFAMARLKLFLVRFFHVNIAAEAGRSDSRWRD